MSSEVPRVDFAPFLEDTHSSNAKTECEKLVKSLVDTGIAIVKDPRVDHAENNTFIDMMEQYFNQSTEQKMKDVRQDLHYQVGATPGKVEVPRDHSHVAEHLDDENKPHPPGGADPKWRFFWRIGERPQETKFSQLNADDVVPEKFPQWEKTMNRWGSLMLQAVTTAAEMFAVGNDLPEKTFSDMMKHGPHLLAPTGSDLNKYNEVGTVLAGFHTDLNFLTIHGKSRFPGLYVWKRNQEKMLVRVPDGCLLIQAGKQIEHLTGGVVKAGFHEVVVCKETLPAIERAREQGSPLWRVSSTLFSHIASDNTLKPLDKFNPDTEKYPPMLAGDQVQKELDAIELGQK
eukprot:gb/GECH01013088.1/.p1 GENE.gb/GECH01013088.1/~~gb/GECH01013088.1/.p1  ORF type:complete len:344 (+),score=97.62 gb/GECH01013088.1/:1-1032(+)